MDTYVVLIDYTDQGIRNIRESPQRAGAFIESATQAGVTVKDIYWTSGGHDGVLVLESDDDATVSKLMLSLAHAGNVRTQMLRAFNRSEMESLLASS